jgi:O-antigen/teichoic acid export membrane protein
MTVTDPSGNAYRLSARLASSFSAAHAWLGDSSDRSRAQRGASVAFLIRVASAALAFFSQVLLARLMGSSEFGIFAYVTTWIMLASSLVNFGLDSAAQRFVSQYSSLKAFDLLRGFLSGALWFSISFATGAAIVCAAAISLLGPWLGAAIVVPLYLGCLSLPFYALASTLDGIARAFGWVNLALLPLYIFRPLGILMVLAIAYLAGLTINTNAAIGATVIATAVPALLALIVIKKRLKTKVAPGPKAYRFALWLTVALPMFFYSWFWLFLTYTDVLVLQRFASPEQIAIYYAATKTVVVVTFVYFAVQAAVAHKFAEYHAAGDHDGLEDFLADTVRWTFWPSLGMTLVLLALGKPILWLFGPAFVEGYSLLFILAIGLMVRAALGPVERLLTMLGEQTACAFVYAAAFAFNVGACLILIPRLGIEGAAWSVTLALIVESIGMFWVSKRRLGLHPLIFGRPKRS